MAGYAFCIAVAGAVRYVLAAVPSTWQAVQMRCKDAVMAMGAGGVTFVTLLLLFSVLEQLLLVDIGAAAPATPRFMVLLTSTSVQVAILFLM